MSVFLRNKVQKETGNKRRRINTKKQIPNKAVKTSAGTTCIFKMEELGIVCLEKRQQSSPALMFV